MRKLVLGFALMLVLSCVACTEDEDTNKSKINAVKPSLTMEWA